MYLELITTLEDIRFGIYLLIVIVVLNLIANWIRAGVALKNAVKRELDDLFINEASALYEKEDYSELLEYCNKELTKKPSHANALWHKSKALYQLNRVNHAKQCFVKLVKVEPNWEESYITPFMEKIECETNENR